MIVSVCCKSVPYNDELFYQEGGDWTGICLECRNDSVFINVKKQDVKTSKSELNTQIVRLNHYLVMIHQLHEPFSSFIENIPVASSLSILSLIHI